MLNIERSALDALAALLRERAGLKLSPEGYYGLRLALTARMPALGISNADEYVSRLRELAGEHELRSLLPLVTVGHTEFFRDPRQFHALESHIIPELLASARKDGRKVRIWSAGCATGEEPYSLAMVLAEKGADPGEVEILATDLNMAAVENAKAGRFAARRLAGVSEARLNRFFSRSGDAYHAAPTLQAYVHFEAHNLAAPLLARTEPGTTDLILCRNVIIYFDLPTIRALMDRFSSALRNSGYLLLGYSESLFKVYDRFDMVEVAGAFVYRRAAPVIPGMPAVRTVSTRTTQELPAVDLRNPPLRRDRSRPETLPPTRSAEPRPSSGRHPAVEMRIPPAAYQTSPPLLSPPPAKRLPTERLDAAVALMNGGQFEGALRATRSLCDDEPSDLNALLTLANLHALLGHEDAAHQAFSLALSREPLCVEARIFGGVAALQKNKFEDARGEFGRALFLEPTLAIGHYLLAQTHERLGDRHSARRSYRNAIAQLKYPQRPLAGHYPDMLESVDAMMRAARYALAALEEA